MQPQQASKNAVDHAVVTNCNDGIPTPANSEKDEILVTILILR
jgi:hypothetical protein